LKNKLRLRSIPTWRILPFFLSIIVLGSGLFLFFFLGHVKNAFSAANSDYQSNGSGNWNTANIWQKNSSSWATATTAPTSADGIITIRSGHTITITANVTADQIIINPGGTLILNSGVTLTLANGTGNDLDVSGVFKNAGTVTISSGATIVYQNGGTYQHNYTSTAGTIPIGTWNTGSICEIKGFTTNTTMPSGMNQAFDTFKWNCTSQSADINFLGALTSFTGDFQVVSTGANQLLFSNNSLNFALTGDLIINGGILTVNNGSGKTTTFNQTGNVSITGGAFIFVSGTSSVGTFNLTGNYTQTGGSFDFASGAWAMGTMNTSGNFTHSGGTLTASGILVLGKTVFNNTGTQSYTASGNTVSGNVDYVVNSGAILNMGTSSMFGRNFTLNSGGSLGIGSPDGITTSASLGNIQVSGTRSYNTGANYIYNGTGNQVTGNGLPSSINTLTVNNGNILSLTNSVSIAGTLTFQSGKIKTGNNEVNIINTSTSSISGYTNLLYVSGNLRRSISASGAYSFPVGTDTYSELMTVTLTGVTGVTSLLSNFTIVNTNDTINGMSVDVNSTPMTEMLDYGYWSLIPNSSLTGGSYAVQLSETGHSNTLSPTTIIGLLSRTGSTAQWSAIGAYSAGTVSSNTITSQVSTMNNFYQFGIAIGEFPSFSNPTLKSGTAGQVGAIYLFPNIMKGIDAWVEIKNIAGGATLSSIDNTGSGYNASFQPFVSYPANSNGYVEWKFMFKKAGTSTDTTIKKMIITGVDLDGSSNSASDWTEEFVSATPPSSYLLDPATILTVDMSNNLYTATSSTYQSGNIDTAHHESMFQVNYYNVNNILYRTGAINHSPSSSTRQSSIIFKGFYFAGGVVTLPIKLMYFNAKMIKQKVKLTWETAAEINNDYFTIERSEDGINFNRLFTKRGAGNSTIPKFYEMTDENPLPDQAYYRLKQTDYDGKFTYSNIRTVNNKTSLNESEIVIQSISPNPFQSDLQINFNVKSKGTVKISLINNEGKLLENNKVPVDEGSAHYNFEKTDLLKPGTYFIIVEQNGERQTKKVIKN
jgi:hypothetical protein